MNVLLVDDNPDQLSTLAFLISTLGHRVRTASTVHEAIHAARSFRPHIAFIDVGLPDADGRELARVLKAELGGVRLIAMTGHGGSDDREKSFDAGFDDHLIKPVEFAVLESLLKHRAL